MIIKKYIAFDYVDESGKLHKTEFRNEKGNLHREDGPAKIEFNEKGSEIYVAFLKDGIYHNENGWAKKDRNGTLEWYINGKLHCLDGPAIEHYTGRQEWWVDDKRHREDGPAIIGSDGSEAYYLNDKHYLKEDFDKEIQRRKQNLDGKVVEIEGKKYKLTLSE